MATFIQGLFYGAIGLLLGMGNIHYDNWLFWVICICVVGSNICEDCKKR